MPLSSPAPERFVIAAGSRKNRPIDSASAKTIVPVHAFEEISSSSSPSCALAEMPSALKPMASDSNSATTPRITGRRRTRCFLSTETSGNDWTSISSSGVRTATAHVETPRIITPSRTAWPPIGASFAAKVRSRSSLMKGGFGYLLGWRLAARRLNRSTRPPVSTSF